jgi:hypothetical protein
VVALDVGAGVAGGSGLFDGVGQMSAETIPPRRSQGAAAAGWARNSGTAASISAMAVM